MPRKKKLAPEVQARLDELDELIATTDSVFYMIQLKEHRKRLLEEHTNG